MSGPGARAESVELVRAGRTTKALEMALQGLAADASSLGLVCALLVLHRDLAADVDANESLAPYESLLDTIATALRPGSADGSAASGKAPRILARTRRGGRLVSFGRCDLQLGYATADSVAIQVLPRRIDLDVRITKMSTAKHHTVAIDASGRLWTWGHGQHGRLGLGDEKTRIEPNLVRDMTSHHVTRVAAGKDHTLAVTSHGLLFAWGSNEKGQLGIGTGRGGPFPRRVKLPVEDSKSHTGSAGAGGSSSSAPTSEAGSSATMSDKARPLVMLVAASASHSVAVDRHGRAFAWGANDKCQLGIRDGLASRVASPRLMTAAARLAGRGVIQACSAEGVTYLLSKEGDVLQVGLGLHAPTKVRLRLRNEDEDSGADWSYGGRGGESGVRVSHLACGPSHAAAVTTEGMLFTWGTHASLLGHADKGCGRDSDQAHTTRPRRVAALRRHRIVSVSCSRNHTCALDERGNAYTWGNGERGALGSSQTYQPTPTRVTTLRGIAAASAADAHTVALVQTREPHFSPLTLAAALRLMHPDALWPDRLSAAAAGTTEVADDLVHGSGDEAEDDRLLDEESDSDACDDVDLEPVVYEPMSLQLMCERAMTTTVNLWNVIPTWEFADHHFAAALADFCRNFVALNLDTVLAMSNTPNVEERVASLCQEDLFDASAILGDTATPPGHDLAEGPAAELASPQATGISAARLRSPSVVSSFSSVGDLEEGACISSSFSPACSASSACRTGSGASAAQPRSEEAELASLSLPRLRKRLEAFERQRLGIEDMQLKLMASTPDRSKPQARRARALEDQMLDLLRSVKLVESEIALRSASGGSEDNPALGVPGDPLWCRTCSVRVNSEHAMVHHVSGKKHRKNQAKEQEESRLQEQMEKTLGHTQHPANDAGGVRRDVANPWQSPQVSATPAPGRVSTDPKRRTKSVAAPYPAPSSSSSAVASGPTANLRDIQQEEESRKLFQEQRRRHLQSIGMLPTTPQQGIWRQQVVAAASPPDFSLMGSPSATSAYLSPLQSRRRSGSVAPALGATKASQLPPPSTSSPEAGSSSARRGVSLSDYLTPKPKASRSAAPWAQKGKSASGSSARQKAATGASASGDVLRAMQQSLDLQSIQMEQQAESASGRNRCDLQVSSWGMHTRNGDQTLSDIQTQQALEMESERLALELAALEGMQQDAIFTRSTQPEPSQGSSSQQRKSRSRRGGNPKKKGGADTGASARQGARTNGSGKGSGKAGGKSKAKSDQHGNGRPSRRRPQEPPSETRHPPSLAV